MNVPQSRRENARRHRSSRGDGAAVGIVRGLARPAGGRDPAATGRGLLIGRVGEPADIAAAYLYLMREGFSTGAIIQLDGGHILA